MDLEGKRFLLIGGAGLIGSHTVDELLKEDVKEILGSLKLNSEKICEHGKRADSIVKGMLAHSHGRSSEKEVAQMVGADEQDTVNGWKADKRMTRS